MTSNLSISKRAAVLQGWAAPAVRSTMAELRACGKDVLDLATGDPDFRPPRAVREAVSQQSLTQPIPVPAIVGELALREAVAAELGRVHGRSFDASAVLVASGVAHALANLFFATLDPADEVVVPAPYAAAYPDLVRLAGGRLVIAPTQRDERWRLRPDVLERVVGARTRFVVLNSPNDPTGSGYRRDEVRSLGEVLAARAPNAWFICDDVHRALVYDGYVHTSAFRALDRVMDRIVIVEGISRAFAMGGYPIGFLVAPPAVVAAGARIQIQCASGAGALSQHAALVALTDPSISSDVQAAQEALARRRGLMLAGLAQVPGIEIDAPDGGVFVLIDVSSHVGNPRAAHGDDIAFARWLLEDRLVATMPGTAFGAPGFLRVSYATDDPSIIKGCRRIAEALSGLPTA